MFEDQTMNVPGPGSYNIQPPQNIRYGSKDRHRIPQAARFKKANKDMVNSAAYYYQDAQNEIKLTKRKSFMATIGNCSNPFDVTKMGDFYESHNSKFN